MFWALAALFLSGSLLAALVWGLSRGRGDADPDPDLLRPPPPQGFANLIEAEYDFVELDIWEDMIFPDADDETRPSAYEERRADGPP